MIAASLQSGSNGNCLYVEAAGVRLLFDAGISGVQAQTRLQGLGRDIRQVDALVVSHDHSDHVKCAGVFQRKFGLPIYVTPATLKAANQYRPLGHLRDVRHFQAGEALTIGQVKIETIRTPHDAADGVGFIVEAQGRRLGILTDLGHPFAGLAEAIASLDAVFLESNYDPDMLAGGDYPEYLKARIAGPRGHLANFESAALLRKAKGKRLRWACLSHLSENNNTPALARAAHRDLAATLAIHVASRHEPVGPFEV